MSVSALTLIALVWKFVPSVGMKAMKVRVKDLEARKEAEELKYSQLKERFDIMKSKSELEADELEKKIKQLASLSRNKKAKELLKEVEKPKDEISVEVADK